MPGAASKHGLCTLLSLQLSASSSATCQVCISLAAEQVLARDGNNHVLSATAINFRLDHPQPATQQ